MGDVFIILQCTYSPKIVVEIEVKCINIIVDDVDDDGGDGGGEQNSDDDKH